MESAGVRYLRTSEISDTKTTSGYYTVRSTLNVVLCLLYTYWDIHHFGGLFILNLSKMLKFAATHQEITMNSFLVETFLKNINAGKDTVR